MKQNKTRKFPKKSKQMSMPPSLTKLRLQAALAGGIAVAVILFISFYFLLTPLNLHAPMLWITVFFATLVFALLDNLAFALGCQGYEDEMANEKTSWRELTEKRSLLYLVPLVLAVFTILAAISGISAFHAGAYASLLKVETAVFEEDLAETLGTDSIALMDTMSAQMLGDREIGSLSNVVSQYNVSDDYAQIDLKGSPKKVAALDYAGFFKWNNNKKEGVPGYVTVDPVSMSASYQECASGMIYVPSAYFGQDAARHIRMHYPTILFGNLHFEIDEEGRPYYVASIYEKTISLFGGRTVTGAVILDPVTGSLTRYDLADVPAWVDVVYDGDLICEQYNWYGTLQNGFVNSVFGKKGCKQVTTYSSEDDEESDDVAPTSDYGFVAKDGDIWIYTGITSVNGDSSNIGFLLANERTGETHYYEIAGADEKSAMAAAEGEVQEKGYQASFPSLINVDGNPTYIMVLKDASGLVKLYAAVNVEQYNLVTTAATQTECMNRYRSLLGLEDTGSGNAPSADGGQTPEEPLAATDEAVIRIQDIRYITIDGNTYIYLIDDKDSLYRAKASEHEEMLLLQAGDTAAVTYTGKEIVTCVKKASGGINPADGSGSIPSKADAPTDDTAPPADAPAPDGDTTPPADAPAPDRQ